MALIPKMSMNNKVEDIICARIANHSDSATLAIRRDNVSLSSSCSSLSPVSGEYNILLSDSILFQRMLLLYGFIFVCESSGQFIFV